MKIAFQNFLSQKPSKFIYQEIVSKNCERPISCQGKWSKDINLPATEIINWKVAYETSLHKDAQRAVNLSLSTSNCYIACYQLFLKKSRS